jgi:putative ABC transport system ATP-binding protein
MELLAVSGLTHSYDGAHPVLLNVDFRMEKGDLVYISGSSGGGKTTFLKILNRLVEPKSGSFMFNGVPYGSFDVKMLRRKIQLVQQAPVMFNMTVEENLRMATPSADGERIVRLLVELNLSPEILGKNAQNLSVGQKQRVSMVRSLLLEPELLLLDEPTASLDPENRDAFQKTFENLRKEHGLSAIWVTHDEGLAKRAVARSYRLVNGVLVKNGN